MSSPAHDLEHAVVRPPLCVDLDGTLLRSDLLLESFLAVLRRRPLKALSLLGHLARGRAAFKQAVAEHADLDVAKLPYREDLLRHVCEEHAKGRYTLLVTASAEKYARAVAAHAGCFDDVLASTGARNLKGRIKADALARRFGDGGFAYAGDSMADVPVWLRSSSGLIVGANHRTERAARGATAVEAVLCDPRPRITTVIEAIRPHQWLKNLLVFVPLFAGHQVTLASAAVATAAFAAFCLIASAAYLLNDLLDLEADRRHPSKRYRPLAAGTLPLRTAMLLIPALLAAGFGVALPLSGSFLACLAGYFGLTVAYSICLKRHAMVDVMTLAGLYTLRVIAGGAAVGIEISFWLLAFSMFLFLSLALVKRTTEVQLSLASGHDLSHRGYAAGDAEPLRSMGIASGYLAVLVAALYINSDDVTMLYETPRLLWLLCPCGLYWVNRVWLMTIRGEMHDDPLVFAIKDRVSLIVGAAAAVILVGAV